jgi:hypothetical protein
MKTEFHSMRTELETAKWPIDPAVISNHMEIRLCSIEGMSWTRQDDGQLVSLTIHFVPNRPYVREAEKDECIGTYGELSQCSEP